MGDYIEAIKLLEYLDVMIGALSYPLSEAGEDAKAYVEGFKEARSVVERFPTADAAPVVHGRWINKSGGFWEAADCSNCGERHLTVGISPNYCPSCGARMDLEETDDG